MNLKKYKYSGSFPQNLRNSRPAQTGIQEKEGCKGGGRRRRASSQENQDRRRCQNGINFLCIDLSLYEKNLGS